MSYAECFSARKDTFSVARQARFVKKLSKEFGHRPIDGGRSTISGRRARLCLRELETLKV